MVADPEDAEVAPSAGACGGVLTADVPLWPPMRPEASGPQVAGAPAAGAAGDGVLAAGALGSSMILCVLILVHMSTMSLLSAMSIGQRSYHSLTWLMWDASTGESMGPSQSVGKKAWNPVARGMAAGVGGGAALQPFLAVCHSPASGLASAAWGVGPAASSCSSV